MKNCSSNLRLHSLVALSLLATATSAAAIMPPRPGQPLADAVRQRLKAAPSAFQLEGAFVQLARRARENSRAFLSGEMTFEAAQRAGGVAVNGVRRIPVIPATFSDSPAAQYPVADLQKELFDGPWPSGTMTDYYREISYGHLTLTGTVLPRIKLPEKAVYYVGKDYTDAEGKTQHCHGLCDDAKVDDLAAIVLTGNDASVDFGLYDNDGPDGVPNSKDDDGYVDVAVFVHPGGGGECGGDNTDIWSYQYRLKNDFDTNDKRPNGALVKVRDYVIAPSYSCDGKTMIEIGVFAHELGHAFGLPDLYDTSRPPVWQGPGIWDLMALGSWGADFGSPQTPTHMSAWTKSWVGWLEPVEASRPRMDATLRPLAESPQAFQQSYSKTKRYLAEYRSRIGFDKNLPGEGLLLWQLDDAKIETGIRDGNVNADIKHPGLMLIEADGANCLHKWEAEEGDPPCGPGIPFPGSANKRNIDSTTRPSMTSKLAICGIGDPGNTLVLSLLSATSRCPAEKHPAGAPTGKAAEIPLPELQRNTAAFAGETVTVVGTLRNAGTNYMTDRRLELDDGAGHRVSVSAPKVLEVAPPKPSSGKTAPETLSNILNQKIAATGVIRKSETGFELDIQSTEVVK